MRDFEDDYASDYKGRDIKAALQEAKETVDIILSPPDQIPLEVREDIARKTVRNFRDHINKGFLEYRKSVTEATRFAVTEWTGQGSILIDVLGREFIDALGGYGLYSAGIRHPKIVAAVKAQLDRSPQYSQEMLDPLRAQLARVLALLLPGKLQYGFFANSGMGAPSSGQIHITSSNSLFTSIPQYGINYTYALTPGGGPNTGSPRGTGTVNGVIDIDLLVGGFVLFSTDDDPFTKHIYAVSDPNPGPITCNKVDGGTATYTTADLNAIKALLPGSAIYWSVECDAFPLPPVPDPCFGNAMFGMTNIAWTSGDVTACDGNCGDPGPCAGGPAE